MEENTMRNVSKISYRSKMSMEELKQKIVLSKLTNGKIDWKTIINYQDMDDDFIKEFKLHEDYSLLKILISNKNISQKFMEEILFSYDDYKNYKGYEIMRLSLKYYNFDDNILNKIMKIFKEKKIINDSELYAAFYSYQKISDNFIESNIDIFDFKLYFTNNLYISLEQYEKYFEENYLSQVQNHYYLLYTNFNIPEKILKKHFIKIYQIENIIKNQINVSIDFIRELNIMFNSGNEKIRKKNLKYFKMLLNDNAYTITKLNSKTGEIDINGNNINIELKNNLWVISKGQLFEGKELLIITSKYNINNNINIDLFKNNILLSCQSIDEQIEELVKNNLIDDCKKDELLYKLNDFKILINLI
jgi:hypothetical protein